MSIRKSGDLKKTILNYLAGRPRQQVTSAEVAEAMAKKFRLSQHEINRKIWHKNRPSGESQWKLEIRHVKNDLVKSGDIKSGLRGVWELSD